MPERTIRSDTLNGLFSRIRRATDRLAQICEYLSWAILVTWVCLVTVGVVMRYIFTTPLLFQVDLVSALLVVFCASSFASLLARGEHISVDIVTRSLRPSTRRFLLGFSYFATFLFAILMLWATRNLIWISFMMKSKFDVSGLLLWPFQVAFAIGFVLLGLVALARFAELVFAPMPRPDGATSHHSQH